MLALVITRAVCTLRISSHASAIFIVGPGGSEVGKLWLPVLIEYDVLGLQVSVDYALLPEVLEAIHDVCCKKTCGLDL